MTSLTGPELSNPALRYRYDFGTGSDKILQFPRGSGYATLHNSKISDFLSDLLTNFLCKFVFTAGKTIGSDSKWSVLSVLLLNTTSGAKSTKSLRLNFFASHAPGVLRIGWGST
jgi:hypothetical protein